MNPDERELREKLVSPFEDLTRQCEAASKVVSRRHGQMSQPVAETAPTRSVSNSREPQRRHNPRGVFQKVPGKNSPWWICCWDAQGRKRREKAGTKSAAIDLYRKRKNEALQGKKLPEKLRRATVSFCRDCQRRVGLLEGK